MPGSHYLRPVMYFIVLAAISAVLAFAVILPLWKFATTDPSLYTLMVLILFGAGIIYSIIRGIMRQYTGCHTASEKKQMLIKLVIRIVAAAAAVICLWACIHLVLQAKRLSALFVLVSGILAVTGLHFLKARLTDD